VATRNNASPNPALKNNNTGWGGSSTPTRSTGLSGLPRTTGAHYSINGFASLPTATVGAGETWTLSCYFQNNTGTNLGTKTVYFVCKKPGDDFSITTSVALPTGITRVSITAVTLTGTTGLYMLIDSFDASIGAGVEITAVLFEKVSGPPDTYFDGDTASATWDGADGNSPSTLTTGTDTFITDPVAGGSSSSGTSDGIALGGTADGGSTGGTADGVALGSTAGGSGSGGQPDGVAIGTSSGASGTGGTPDALLANTFIPDPVQNGAGTGGTADSVTTGPQVVHDQMVMPIAIFAQGCLVTEIGKVANPPAAVQIRPGASFAAMVDSKRDECCLGIAYVRPGAVTPTSGAWPQPLSSVQGPSASRGRAAEYAVTLELGVYRCLPTISNAPDASQDDFPTAAQWLQAAQEQQDDAAALRRAVCCLQAKYGDDGVLAGAVQPLENSGNCGGVSLSVQVRAPACDCVG
jgi:hypothetical protein